MNKKQRIIIFICSVLIVIPVIIWISDGCKIFTQTKVLVEKKDELFGTTYHIWKDQFILGLDLTGLISAIIIVTGTVLFFIFKKKKGIK